jgi:carotenoid 1,2-hydratase
VSDDRRFAITLIAFLGSVFSPYYAWSGRGAPLDHCAVNIALYGARHARWAMTERSQRALARTADCLTIGPSSLRWDDDTLVIMVDEVAVPIPRRVRGTVRVKPLGFTGRSFALDAVGRHVWQPIAPRARIEVAFDRPNLRWSGDAYLDSNFGQEPLEVGFKEWTWSRAHRARDSVVLYDARRRDGTTTSLALRFRPEAEVVTLEPPPSVPLPTTGWRLSRSTRADAGSPVSIIDELEDAPFYARALVATSIAGERAIAMHERLSLDRFRSKIVQAMLPFRMPRQLF